MDNALKLNTVVLSGDRKSIVILDQTLLPKNIKYLKLSKRDEIWEAIYKLRVRGAPAIGCAAAFGLYILASGYEGDDVEGFLSFVEKEKDYLNSSRPTAVNLSWALTRLWNMLLANKDKHTVSELKEMLGKEADTVWNEDVAIRHGCSPLQFPDFFWMSSAWNMTLAGARLKCSSLAMNSM